MKIQTPSTIVLSRSEWSELVRRANADAVAEHRAAYRERLRARLEARRAERKAQEAMSS